MHQEVEKYLKLANSYIDDVSAAIHPITELNPNTASELLRTLDLAEKQIEKAEIINPKAVIAYEVEGQARNLDIPTLRAAILLYRGIAKGFGLGERASATKSIEQSLALVENFPNAHFALGCIYAESGKKTEALQHLRRAVELAPENLEYQKFSDRIEHESAISLKAGAFRGSWKVILILGGLAIFPAFSSDINTAIFSAILFGVPAAIYWWWKSR
jgi:tetratricopeptide (TPR) repeat protein